MEDEVRPIAFVPFEYDPLNRLPMLTHHKSIIITYYQPFGSLVFQLKTST